VLVPEMERYGYKKPMTLGPIMGAGGLACMIPPSALAVILANLGGFSIGKLIIAIIVPGFMMAGTYATYIIIRCYVRPNLAPYYKMTPTPLFEKITETVRYVLPLGIIIFLTIVIIFLGIASPTAASAAGAFGCLIVSVIYGKLKWQPISKALLSTLEVQAMVFMIAAGSSTFSLLLAFSGATDGLTRLVANLQMPPIFVLIGIQLVVGILGCFMDSVSIMMVTLPVFMPIVKNFGFDPVWFGAIMLLNLETGMMTPPFGVILFVMKGVAPLGTTMREIIMAGLPFVALNLMIIILLIAFPTLVLWLPGLM
jgi:tripartite ATP-independent transporter DctM subunit